MTSNILIVDDRPANLQALSAALEPLGQRIVTASSGAEALKRLLEPTDFAVVLMDVRMPELDGFETVRMIRTRERTRRVPVIFISGYNPDEKMIAQSYGYGGIADFLLKPFNPDVLRAKVSLFVELAKMREEVRQLTQREAEQAAAERERQSLYQLFQRAPAAIAVLRGPNHICEYVNEMGLRISDHPQPVGKPAFEVFPTLRELDLMPALDRVYLTGEPFTIDQAPVRCSGPQGPEERHFSCVFQAERDPSGKIWGVFAFGFDMTAEVQARELRERLLAVISHDLRNPLSAISVGVSNLLRQDHSEEDTGRLKRIQQSAARMSRMISQLLDFAAAQRGGLKVAHDDTDLAEVLRQAAEELNVTHPGRVMLELSGEARLRGDADRLAEVMSNLIGNAIQHGDGGKVLVRLRAGADELEVQVRNGGPHIPKDMLGVIFEPYRRAKRRVMSDTRSVGLGLYIAREIVTAHGGTIEVHSPDGEGQTTFTVRLPRRTERDAPVLSVVSEPQAER